MPRLAANLSMMFEEHPLLDRFAAAAACGFRGVEMHYPYAWPAAALRQQLTEHGLEMLLINVSPGNLDAGERGIAALPGREADFGAAMQKALDYAGVLGCERIHAMAGVLPEHAEADRYMAVYVANLRWAARACEDRGIKLLIEPLNATSAPGYLLSRLEQAEAVIDAVGHANLWIQFDLFHLQIMGGDLLRRFTAAVARIAHVQIAGVPDRHEPDRGEVNYRYFFERMDQLGYDGWVGCEYTPAGCTRDGLRWAEPYGIRASARNS